MTTGYYCAIFPFCGGRKKKDDKKTKAFYDWATTGIPVTKAFYDWATTGIPVNMNYGIISSLISSLVNPFTNSPN